MRGTLQEAAGELLNCHDYYSAQSCIDLCRSKLVFVTTQEQNWENMGALLFILLLLVQKGLGDVCFTFGIISVLP